MAVDIIARALASKVSSDATQALETANQVASNLSNVQVEVVANTIDSYKLSLSDVDSTIVTPNLFNREKAPSISWQNHDDFTLTRYLGLIGGRTVGNAYSVYWPWVIRVDDKLDNALGKYYMYYSSDHAGTTGGIDLAYANNLTGPWITYTGGTLDANYPQRIYINYNGSTRVETETPSVLWDSNNSKFIMLFQSASSYSGEAQSSWRVESTDGITWTNKAKLFDIDVTRIQGNLHNGYVMPFEFDGIIFAYSLMGGGNGGAALSWSEDGGYNWITDHRRLGRWGLSNNENRFLYPNHGTPIQIKGQTYFVGAWSNFSSGTSVKQAYIAMAPMSDLRHIVGKPRVLFSDYNSTYESLNLRTMSAYCENGLIYIFYSCAQNSQSWINVAVLDANMNATSLSPHLTATVQPSSSSVVEGRISSSLTFEATATDGSAVSYQWYDTNGIIPGVININYTLDTTLTAGSYSYYCVASATGIQSLTSNTAVITVIKPTVTITTQPASSIVVTEGSITEFLNVIATLNVTGSLNYQWYKNSSAISGATNSTYSLETTLTEGSYTYYCIVSSDGAISVNSNNSVVTVQAVGTPEITITTQPENITVTTGSITSADTISVVATISDPEIAIVYQWYLDGTAIEGATSSILQIPVTLAAGSFSCYCELSATGVAAITSDTITITCNAATVYLAKFTMTGTPNGETPASISDESGNNNGTIVLTGFTTYDTNGHLVMTADNSSSISQAGSYSYKQVVLSGLTLPAKYKIHTKFNSTDSIVGVTNGISHRLHFISTFDWNTMVGSNGSGVALKFESTSIPDINATFTTPNLATDRGTITNIVVDFVVDNDVVSTYAYAYDDDDVLFATSTLLDQVQTGLTAAIQEHSMFLGNRTTTPYRAINGYVSECWIEEVK